MQVIVLLDPTSQVNNYTPFCDFGQVVSTALQFSPLSVVNGTPTTQSIRNNSQQKVKL